MITSVANQKVKQVVAWQTKAKERKKDNIFLVEGLKMFEEAPEKAIREVYIEETLLEKLEKGNDVLSKLERVGFEVVSSEVFKKMSDTQTPQGILAIVERPAYKFEELLKIENPLFVILEDLQDPGNLGTMVRTGKGAEVSAVFMTKNTV